MITIRFLYGILKRVGSAFTALLNMQCWKLELTKTVNRNANCSFFELIRQNMRFKLPQWYIRKYALFFFFFFFFFVICSQSLDLHLKWSYSMLIKTKSQNEWMIFYHIHPSRTENPKMYSCGELAWNDPIGLLDIAHKWKKLTSVLHVGFVLFPVCQIIFCWKWLSSEHVQTDGFESFWYSNFVFLMIAFTTGLSGFVQTKAPIFSVNMN